MNTAKVISKYSNEVAAAQKQNISMNKVFAKLEPQPDGSVKASYPLVKAQDGHIPTDASGKVICDASRLGFAKNLAGFHGEDSGVKAAIEDASAAKATVKAAGHEVHAGVA